MSSSPQLAFERGSIPCSIQFSQERLHILLDITSHVALEADVGSLLHELLGCVRGVIECDGASLALLDEEKPGVLRECALEYPGNSGRIKDGQLIFGEQTEWLLRFMDSGAPLGLTAVELAREPAALAESFKSLCHLPLISRGNVCGVLSFASFDDHAFDDVEPDLLQHVTNHIAVLIENAIAHRQLAALKEQLTSERVYLEDEILSGAMFEEIVGSAKALLCTLGHVARVAPTDSTVLITGESGTGKELIARTIHKRSRRTNRPFIRVNCAAIPPSLIASELFGHEKGAFTGATERRMGRFELADGGTIFLDEIGDIPADTQIALLRVLQEREFERVGGSRPISVDVRVVAATNRDLKAAVDAGTFRLDLFYRLNVFPVRVPSLRERADDIPLLAKYFIDRFATSAGKKIKNIEKRTLESFQAYHWPGNIRELQNVIERAMILCDRETFSVDESWMQREPTGAAETPVALTQALVSREKEMIETALEESRGRIFGPSGAAIKLGIPRSTLESKIKSLRINKHRFKSEERRTGTVVSNFPPSAKGRHA